LRITPGYIPFVGYFVKNHRLPVPHPVSGGKLGSFVGIGFFNTTLKAIWFSYRFLSVFHRYLFYTKRSLPL
jgi:hypothetical protein